MHTGMPPPVHTAIDMAIKDDLTLTIVTPLPRRQIASAHSLLLPHVVSYGNCIHLQHGRIIVLHTGAHAILLRLNVACPVNYERLLHPLGL